MIKAVLFDVMWEMVTSMTIWERLTLGYNHCR